MRPPLAQHAGTGRRAGRPPSHLDQRISPPLRRGAPEVAGVAGVAGPGVFAAPGGGLGPVVSEQLVLDVGQDLFHDGPADGVQHAVEEPHAGPTLRQVNPAAVALSGGVGLDAVRVGPVSPVGHDLDEVMEPELPGLFTQQLLISGEQLGRGWGPRPAENVNV